MTATSELRGGIDLGGAKIQTVVVDAQHRPLGQARTQTPQKGGPDAIAAAMAATLAEAAGAAGVQPGELPGIGVCAPGDADTEHGTVANANNLDGWADVTFPLAEDLTRRLGPPVRLANDVTMATLGEFRLGAARDEDSVLGVFWGTGVGAGIVLDGHVWNGRGAAGEIGHMVVVDHGDLCSCGNHGCVEAYAGRGPMERKAREHHAKGTKTRLFKLMEEHGRDRLTSGIWKRALEHDDKLARRLMAEAVDALGAGVASAVNLLDVGAVVLGGGMGLRFAEQLRSELEASIHEHLFVKDEPPKLLVAELGDLGGAIGAALLVPDAAVLA